MATPQLNPTMVEPAASASSHRGLWVQNSVQTAGRREIMTTQPSKYVAALAHRGCKPPLCISRSGHQEVPHTKALSISAI